MKSLKTLSYRAILVTYLILCTGILVITAGGYASSIVYIRREIERSGELQVKKLSAEIENEIQLAYQLCDALSVSDKLKETAQIEGTFTPEEIRESMELKDVMQQMAMQNKLCRDLYVYFPKSNSILASGTQRRAGDRDIELFSSQYGLAAEEFYGLMEDEETAEYQIIGDNLIWFLCPVYGEDGARTAVIFAEYSGKSLLGNKDAEGIVSLKSGDGETVLRDGQKTGREQDYIKIEEKMQIFEWSCCILFSNTLFWSELYRFLFSLGIEAVILIAAAVTGSVFLSNRTYVFIGDILKDYRRLSKKVREKEKTEECEKLSRYLSGSSEFLPELQVLKENGEKEEYLVAVFLPGEESREVFKNKGGKGKEENLERFVLENLMKELVFDSYPGILTQVDKYYAVILALGGKVKKDPRELFEELAAFFWGSFHVSLLIMMGNAERGYGHMRERYEALTESIQYLEFWGTQENRGGVYEYGELMDLHENVNYSVYISGSRKLLNCLESEDFEGAYQELNHIYQESFPRDQKYLKYNMYRMYGLIGILVTAIDINATEEDMDAYRQLHYEERLFRIQSIHEFLTESRAIFEDIIKIKEKKAKEREPEWFGRMLDYIEEHYQDAELNVTKLADEFSITVPYLSRSFKNLAGCGVLEYIHRVKLRHVKEMLKNDCSIKNASSAAGYTDAQALTRAFKRYEGITPTQYREMMSKNEG